MKGRIKMKFSMNGYGENTATFRADGIVCCSQTVKMSDNYAVAPCADGDAFIGTAVNVRNEVACVQLAGYTTLTFSGTAPVVGYNALASDGKGGVKVLDGAKEYLVVNVDTDNMTVGIIL